MPPPCGLHMGLPANPPLRLQLGVGSSRGRRRAAPWSGKAPNTTQTRASALAVGVGEDVEGAEELAAGSPTAAVVEDGEVLAAPGVRDSDVSASKAGGAGGGALAAAAL